MRAQTKFVFKKLLYLRDFIIPEKNEEQSGVIHSRETITDFKELEGIEEG